MNPMIKLALKGATGAYAYYRNSNRKRESDIYDSLLDNLRKGNLNNLHKDANLDDLEDVIDAARLEAGEITRDLHDSLDRRRAAFAAAAPDREARRKALKQDAKARKKENSSGGAGKAIGAVLGLAGAAAAGWAVWEYWLSDKLAENDKKTVKTVKTQTTPAAKPAGSTKLVYSTTTEDAGNEMRPKADLSGSAGPLGEEPAVRDEELLSSIDEQLTTLDALDDDQREATTPHHSSSSSDVLHDTGSGNRSDKVSDADTTIGASGRHELRKDAEDKN
ncbi:hypothetical protein V6D40_09460 [Corynebacterium sp. Q4381]|uniref:hypothetical protein n=1 Tax=Corynebacterium sp. Marseille-Q4381 TaxID=3121597 RepID=UPI002FE63849